MTVCRQGGPMLSLEDITQQQNYVKILIVHTPLHLNIDALPRFHHLIKLDLSNNNLASFPSLAHLARLQFLFVHQNRLNIATFMAIF